MRHMKRIRMTSQMIFMCLQIFVSPLLPPAHYVGRNRHHHRFKPEFKMGVTAVPVANQDKILVLVHRLLTTRGWNFKIFRILKLKRKGSSFTVKNLLIVAYLASSESSLAVSIARGLPVSRCVCPWCCSPCNSAAPLSRSVLDIWRGL